MRIRGARNSVFASSKLVLRTHAMYSGEKRITYFRGASPLGLPYTLSREPLRRLAPFAWLASLRALASLFDAPRHSTVHLCTARRGGPTLPATRSLASRFVGSLRSRGSLRSARSRRSSTHLAIARSICARRVAAAPPPPLHALSRAASSARSVRVARFAPRARVALRRTSP